MVEGKILQVGRFQLNLIKMHICSSCFRKPNNSIKTYGKNTCCDESKEEKEKTTFYCCGRIPPEGPYRKRHGMYDTIKGDLLNDNSVELAVEAYEDAVCGVTKILSPEVPYVENLPEELYQGRSIEVHGKLLKDASRFSINLSTGKSNNADLALHFNPRLDRRVIIRNHRIKNKWGVEEITSLQNFPFSLGRNFSVLIFVADEQFLIAVNKIHYCAFAFRIPVERIESLIILGDIILNLVQHSDKTQYPPQILKRTPFIVVPHAIKMQNSKCQLQRKIKALTTGSKIDIHGRVKVLPRAFYINIQKGISVWPHPIIPFHLNYKLHPPGTHKREREIIFNSWLDGFWGKEEIITLCPFLPGSSFHIKILCQYNSYSVFVNDKFLHKFAKRSEAEADSVVIHGDVVINKVLLH